MSGVMTRASRGLALTLAICAALASRPAHAGLDEEAKSRNLFKQAESLANDGRWKEACHLYQAAHDLNSTGGTALRTGDCYEKIADYERALAMYQYVVDHAATDKHPERVTLAQGRVSALKRQLAKDPVQKPTQAPTQQGPLQQRGPTPPPPPPPPEPNRIPALVVGGVGAASLVAGVVVGSLALVQAKDIQSNCGDGASCVLANGYTKPQFESDKAALNTKAWVANITVGVGLAGLATGVILFVLKVPKASSAVKSAVGPQGLTLRF